MSRERAQDVKGVYEVGGSGPEGVWRRGEWTGRTPGDVRDPIW